jgi:hypothetical protein
MVDEALRWNFRRAQERPVLSRTDDKVYWELGGEDLDFLVGDLLVVEEDLANAVVNELRTGFGHSCGADYDYADDGLKLEELEPTGRWESDRWLQFVERVKHEVRYLSTEPLEELKSILWGIDEFRTSDGSKAVRVLQPGDYDAVFYRARRIDSQEQCQAVCLDPGSHLGPPPAKRATPGRLNPPGIPAFYGAFDSLTCVSEVRSRVGGIVAVGRFALVRPATVLDLTVLEREPEHVSYFNTSRHEILSHRMFLADFHKEVSRPVLPQDEALDYIPTQMVAAYLANHFEPRIDAVIYQSAMTGEDGRNIAFLPHAAAVDIGEAKAAWPPEPPMYTSKFDGDLYIIERREEGRDDTHRGQDPLEHQPFALLGVEAWDSVSEPPSRFLAYVGGSLELHRVTGIAHSTCRVTIILPDGIC